MAIYAEIQVDLNETLLQMVGFGMLFNIFCAYCFNQSVRGSIGNKTTCTIATKLMKHHNFSDMPFDFCYVIKGKGSVSYLNFEKSWDSTFIILRIKPGRRWSSRNVPFPFHRSPLHCSWPLILYLQALCFPQSRATSLFLGSGGILKVLYPRLIFLKPRTLPVLQKHLCPLTMPAQVLPNQGCALMGIKPVKGQRSEAGWPLKGFPFMLWHLSSRVTVHTCGETQGAAHAACCLSGMGQEDLGSSSSSTLKKDSRTQGWKVG